MSKISWILVGSLWVFVFLYAFKGCIIKEKVSIPCPSDFKIFTQAYWPAFMENECGPKKEKKCCVNDPNDKGGLTCYGVAIEYNHEFYKYLEAIGYDLKKTKALDVDSAPIEPYAKMKIYMNYFKKPKIAELPSQLREVVFDNSVHAGPGRAIRILQKACGAHVDGHIGPETITGCKGLSPDKYIQKRKEWLQTRPSWKKYPNGFMARLTRQHNQAEKSLKILNKIQKNCGSKLR